MKRKTLSAVLFVLVFIAAYLFLCFGVPGLRIKLEADPAEVFLESIKSMALFKSIISLLAGAIVGMIPLLIEKRGNHKL